MNGPLLDIFWHEDVLGLDTGFGLFEGPASPLLAVQTAHPENADRVRNMREVLLRGPNASRFAWHEGRRARGDELSRFHESGYLADIEAAAAEGRRLTTTTVLSAGSWPAITAAAGTAIAAAEHVLNGSGRPAFALVRPPGHHAAPAMADGYCFLNNAALAAEAALAMGLTRVAILDWDVHHGNGTQEGFYERADVLTVSMHMDHGDWGPTHPQTGRVDERGRGAGEGFNLNVPLPMGSGDAAYLKALSRIVAPAIRDFAPELIVVASGVDAGQFDPNGRQLITTGGFHAMGTQMRALADEVCGGRLLIVQEGGYNPAHSAFCVLAAAEGFAGLRSSQPDPLSYMPRFEDRAERDVAEIERALGV